MSRVPTIKYIINEFSGRYNLYHYYYREYENQYDTERKKLVKKDTYGECEIVFPYAELLFQATTDGDQYDLLMKYFNMIRTSKNSSEPLETDEEVYAYHQKLLSSLLKLYNKEASWICMPYIFMEMCYFAHQGEKLPEEAHHNLINWLYYRETYNNEETSMMSIVSNAYEQLMTAYNESYLTETDTFTQLQEAIAYRFTVTPKPINYAVKESGESA